MKLNIIYIMTICFIPPHPSMLHRFMKRFDFRTRKFLVTLDKRERAIAVASTC